MQRMTVSELARSLVDDKLVTVIVLETGKEFKVQRTALKNVSPWFVKALAEDRFQEGQRLEIRLHDVSQRVFEHVLCWIFNGKLPADPDLDEPEFYENDDFTLATDLWIFGDKYFMPAFQNKVMEQLNAHVRERLAGDAPRVPASRLAAAYAKSPPSSQLRMFLIREIVKGLKFYQTIKDQKNRIPGWGVDIGYTSADIESFGRIPGFTADLSEKLAIDAHHMEHDLDEDLDDFDQYLIPWKSNRTED